MCVLVCVRVNDTFSIYFYILRLNIMFKKKICLAHVYESHKWRLFFFLERPICVMIVNVTVSLSFNLFKVSLNEYEFVRMFLKVKTKIYCCKNFILVFWIRGAAFVHPCVAVAMFFSWI